MKSFALLLLGVVALTQADRHNGALKICAAGGSDGVLVAHQNCNQFYKCAHGAPVALNCPSGLRYNQSTKQCDWADNVQCEDRPIIEIDGGNNGGDEDCNEEHDKAPEICAKDGSDGILVAHENCNQFYKCSQGVPVALNCPSNLLYNPANKQCDWPHNVNCAGRPIVEIDSGDSDNKDSTEEEANTGGNSDPSKAPEICAKDGSNGILVAHENCNQFYKCSQGVPVSLNCPSNLLYNPANEQCDWPHNVNCAGRPIVEIDSGDSDNEDSTEEETNTGGNSDPSKAPEICAKDGSDGILVAHENCNQFYKCSQGVPVALNCPSNLLYNPANEQCDWPHNVNCAGRPIMEIDSGDSDNEDSTEEETNTGGNSDPSKAPEICAKDGSDGILVAHENCNQFYKCSQGVPVALNCPSNLLYNPANEQCDWPHNVNCAGRPIVEIDSGDSDNEDSTEEETNTGGNSDPSKAPEICAKDGSDGILVAHENCNQFYKCSQGVPVAFNCPSNLLFNPANEQCDWPHNVNCADRPNVEIDSGDSNNEDSTEEETNTGGNSDPSKAPEICAKDGSDGILVAHENCNQFYKCSQGVPVALNCPSNLLFNPANEQCDWPHNVNCADRPSAEIDSGDSNNGDSTEKETNTGGNSDPSKAPEICAKDGSNGVLVAHENCNQFYKCFEGSPVALDCPLNLLYNPANEQCDWPENVNCKGRYDASLFLNKHRHAK